MAYLKWNNHFSDKERDRRWKLMRGYMQDKGLDALVALGAGLGHNMVDLSEVELGNGTLLQTLDSYLSGWANRCTVLLPLKGEPVLLGVPLSTGMWWTKDTPKEMLPWIEDVRMHAHAENIAALLKEKGLDKGRVCLAISLTGAGGSRGAGTAYAKRDKLPKLLPECTFVDPGDDLLKLMLVKSEEEQDYYRRCAYAMEQAVIAMARAARVGNSELDVHLAMQKALYENGAVPGCLYIASGPATVGMHGHVLWTFSAGSPRVFEPGDVVQTGCAFAYISGIEAQGQCTVAIPPVSPENAECAKLSRQSYEVGLRTMRPGVPFKKVLEAMQAPIDAGNAFTTAPLIHGYNPYFFSGWCSDAAKRREEEFYKDYYKRFGVAMGETRPSPRNETLLQAGMTFQFEPAACLGRHRVNVGGSVLLTEKGAEPLCQMGTEMRIAGEI